MVASCAITIARPRQRIICRLCRQQRRFQGRGTMRTIFPLVKTEADQKAKFSSTGGYRNVNNNSNRVILDRVVHLGVCISRELLLLRSHKSQERLNKPMESKCDYQVKQTNGKEMCLYTSIRSISFPRTCRAWYI